MSVVRPGMVFSPEPPTNLRLGLFFDLGVFQFDRGTPAKNIDQHFKTCIFFINDFHRTFKGLEGTVDDFNFLADIK